MSSDLERYEKKRDFKRTPEPRGSAKKRARDKLAYVVQKHDARRLHYDLRLEHRGVLKSWAVPKEPGLTPSERRLAVQTEDHPLEYGSFEGEIPANQYGAGSVLIWDRGYWTPEGDPDRAFEEGKLDFELHGEKLRGRWTLVRFAGRGRRERKDNWLLIKRSDRPRSSTAKGGNRTRATPKTPTRPRKEAEAVVEARREGSEAAVEGRRERLQPRSSPASIPGARRGALPARVSPQLATLVARMPPGQEWLHEPKLDGYRLLVRIDDGRVKLVTRRGNDWTDRFPTLAEQLPLLPCRRALLDGEAVVFNGKGLTDFQRLQSAIGERDPAIVLVAFDLLHLDGWDLRGSPLHERKALLRELLAKAPDVVRYGEHVEGNGADFLRQACKLGLEGVIAKRANDPYREERTRSWLKIKCLQRQELVVVGYTDPQGARTGFGALLLGVRDEPGAPLRYAGKVGTGFNERSLRSLHKRLVALERKSPPIPGLTARAVGKGAHWVKPELVAEVAFGEWTSDGRLRHPTFKGLREDKPAEDIVEERPLPAPPAPRAKKRVKLTNPDKVLFPDLKITKRQLADYWQAVADAALPYVSYRPLTLYRCPEGHQAHCFYQKHIGAGVPDAVARIAVEEDGDPYAMVDDVQALVGLAQIGVLELHVWGSRAEHLEQPDIIVFDLDPSEELAWSAVVGAALDLKDRLETLGLVAFARLTGGKGLHVVVPVVPGPDWRAVKYFSRTMVREMVRAEPQRFTASVSKARRTGKIFIDYLRNDRGSTAIGSYSPRAKPGAPVALPVEWSELDRKAGAPPKHSMLEVPKLIRRRKRDPWESFEASRRSLTE